MGPKRLRAVVSEEAYGVSARVVSGTGFRSDAVAFGYRITERLRSRGRECHFEADGGDVVVRIPLGDAPDSEFDVAADDLLEAASW